MYKEILIKEIFNFEELITLKNYNINRFLNNDLDIELKFLDEFKNSLNIDIPINLTHTFDYCIEDMFITKLKEIEFDLGFGDGFENVKYVEVSFKIKLSDDYYLVQYSNDINLHFMPEYDFIEYLTTNNIEYIISDNLIEDMYPYILSWESCLNLINKKYKQKEMKLITTNKATLGLRIFVDEDSNPIFSKNIVVDIIERYNNSNYYKIKLPNRDIEYFSNNIYNEICLSDKIIKEQSEVDVFLNNILTLKYDYPQERFINNINVLSELSSLNLNLNYTQTWYFFNEDPTRISLEQVYSVLEIILIKLSNIIKIDKGYVYKLFLKILYDNYVFIELINLYVIKFIGFNETNNIRKNNIIKTYLNMYQKVFNTILEIYLTNEKDLIDLQNDTTVSRLNINYAIKNHNIT